MISLQCLENRRVLVTGATGFIGGYLCKALTDLGAQVCGTGNSEQKSNLGFEFFRGDITDLAFVEYCVRTARPEFVFHLAATKSRTPDVASCHRALHVNLLGSLNLLQALAGEKKVKRVVVVGTAEEYGDKRIPFKEEARESPTSPYSFSKLCVTHLSEMFFRLYRLPVVVMRPTLAYGPGQPNDMFLPALIESLVADRSFPMSAGRQTRDYVFISDIVDGLLRAALADSAPGHIFNLGSGESIELAKLANMVEKMLGKKKLVKLGAIDYRQGEILSYAVDTSRAKAVLGWSPQVSLEKGLGITISHFRGKAMAR